MQKKDLKFIFFGTPEIAAETLEILKQNGFLPSLVITAPDKPIGRKQTITPPPVKLWAKKNNIPVLQPEKLEQDLRLKIKDLRLDLFIVVAYGKIFPKWLINMPKLETLNIHYSLLPKYRGASPVQTAILNGETETGVTIQKMVYELDAGPIITQEKIKIEPDEKTPELLKKLVKIGANLLTKTLTSISQGESLTAIKQDESQASFCKKITKEDGLIHEKDLHKSAYDSRLSASLYNKFRAYYDWPRIYFIKNGKRIIVTDASLENDQFIIKKVIPEGKKGMNYDDFLKI